MERKLPKNVRQIGNVCDTPKIYVEDYVDTYLNQLKTQVQDEPIGVFLIGENLKIEEQECVCITGALQMQEIDTEDSELKIDEEIMNAATEECKEYFPEGQIVGWFLIAPGKPLGISSGLVKIHEKLFAQENSVFILKDAVDNEELYFAYKYHELMQMGGHYIFYEKNPSMQNYMISRRRQIGVTPFEVVEDRAAKDFRSTIKEKLEQQEDKSNSRLVYATSALLVVVVLAIGISTMNNYDKMNAVQSSVEMLSESVQKSDEEKTVSVSAEATKDAAEKQPVDEESLNIPKKTEVPASTVQEELSEEDYYTVQKGDTLDRISQRVYGTTSEVEAICKMNGLGDGNLIFIGQKLLLP